MQTSNQNSSISGSQATIIQVAKNSATAAIIQNGHHLMIGKLESRPASGVNNNMQSIYPLQYIETAVANSNSNSNTNQTNSDVNNTTVYGTSGQKIFYQDSSHSSIYTTLSGQTATIIPASAIQYIKTRDVTVTGGTALQIQTGPHAQIVHHGGNSYLVQSSTRLEDESPNQSHTTKASPVTVQWLCDNYETAEGVSLPRSTLYNHYLQHCQQEKLEPMNQASFGKLIRSVFFGLRTRRLGTRGNSKYHYYGIRIKSNSVLNHYVEDQTFAMRQYPSLHRQNQDSDIGWRNRYGYGGGGNSGSGGGGGGGDCDGGGASNNGHGDVPESGGHNGTQHSSYLGESSAALPDVSDIMTRAGLDSLTENDCLAQGITLAAVSQFCQMYVDHSSTVLSAVVYLNFKFIESLWQDFWRTSAKAGNHPQLTKLEEKLPATQLLALLEIPRVQSFLELFDNVFYQSLVEVLIPNVLRPIPSALTQSIRHFAKSLEGWMSSATAGLPVSVARIKMTCVSSLAQTLRRHTSLNHLAQAARAVLKNAGQIGQMLTDLNRVDFGNVQEQASWVCGCDGRRVDSLLQEFKRILQQQASLEDWAAWLDRVVDDVLAPVAGSPRYPTEAHQFMLKWSFYSSMVIRDLTLRSAASFGSFHLIRLLYDEYIYYLVEQKVAEHLNQTPVAVTGDVGRQLMASEYNNDGPLDHDKEKFNREHHGIKERKLFQNGGEMSPSSDCRLENPPNHNMIDTSLSVSSYNNSNPTLDDQVDESADDDEGLEEEECQLSVNRCPPLILAPKTDEAVPSRLPVPVTVLSNATRKSVNVTTFGEPQSSTNNIVSCSTATASSVNVTLTTAPSLRSLPSAIKSSEPGNKRIKLVSTSSAGLTKI